IIVSTDRACRPIRTARASCAAGGGDRRRERDARRGAGSLRRDCLGHAAIARVDREGHPAAQPAGGVIELDLALQLVRAGALDQLHAEALVVRRSDRRAAGLLPEQADAAALVATVDLPG